MGKGRKRTRGAISSLVSIGAFSACVFSSSVALADQTLTFDGNVPTGGLDHFFVPFTVPEGTAEIEILHSDESDTNILDWGLNDENGWRGWGGGNTEDAIVNQFAASRSYVPGPITPGTWSVVVGKAKVEVSPAVYHIEVTLRTQATLAPQTNRRPYVPSPPLATGFRYYAGDLHVHDRESGDALPTLDDVGTFAVSRGMDFIQMSDHNVNTQDDYLDDVQSRFPNLLFFPGIEFTTYAGHANALSAQKWVDHKIGQPGVTINSSVDQIIAQGAFFSINHPVLDVGDLCIGCAWNHPDLDPSKVMGVEIETGGLSGGGILFQEGALAFWESFLNQGFHVVGIGGGDDHRAGQETGYFQSALGSPTTLVYASELSEAAIVDGIKKGHVVVKTDSPADPMVELTAGDALPGDSLHQRSMILNAKVTGLSGHVGTTATVHWVKNGVQQGDIPITSDPFIVEQNAIAPATGEDRWRFEVELEDSKMHTITNHVYLTLDPNGPDPVGAATMDAAGGCAVSSARSTRDDGSGVALGSGLFLALSAIIVRRRKNAKS